MYKASALSQAMVMMWHRFKDDAACRQLHASDAPVVCIPKATKSTSMADTCTDCSLATSSCCGDKNSIRYNSFQLWYNKL